MVHGNLVHGKRLFLILRPNTVRYVFFCRALAARRDLHFFRRDGCVARLRAEGRAFRPRDYGAKRRAIAEPKAIITCGSLLQRPKRHWQFTGPATSQKTLANALPKRRAPASQKIGLLRWSKDAHPSSVAPALLCFDWHAQRLRRDCGTTAGRITSCAATAARKRLRRDCAT